MGKIIAGILGIASIFLSANVFAAGTPTVSYHQISAGTLLVGTPTAVDVGKVPVMTDNIGSKFDSGALTITSGSQTVTTSLTACDRAFASINTSGNGSTTPFNVTTSGAGFTIYVYNAVTGATSTSNFTGHWFAIDE